MYDELIIKTFLENQSRLFDENVADSPEDAKEFLEDICAEVCSDKAELMELLDEEMDISELSEDEILDIEEVFAIEDGRYLVVWG